MSYDCASKISANSPQGGEGHCIRFVKNCSNFPSKCDECVRIQGKYTEYLEIKKGNLNE